MICEKLSVSFGTSSSAVGSTMKTTSYCLFVSKSNLQSKVPLTISSIKFAHRFQSAVPDDRSYRSRALVQNVGQHGSFAAWKRVEHKLLRIRNRMLRENPDPQPQKFVRTRSGDDRLQTVVSTRRTTFTDANRSERQR